MKKIIAILTVITLLFALMSVPVLAHKDNKSYGNVTKSADDIKIDAVKDAVYDKGLKLDVNRQYDGEGIGDYGTTGTAWILWQDGFLFVFAEIKQVFLQDKGEAEDKQSGQPWECDSFEVFLDFSNEAEGGDCDQFRIDAWGYRSFEQRTTTGENSYGGDASSADGVFEGAAVINGTNYNVEYKIPFQHPAGAGSQIGLLLQINDMVEGGAGRSIVFSGSSTGESRSWQAAEFDYIVLSDEKVTAVVQEAPAVPDVPEVDENAMGGGDVPVPDVIAPPAPPKTGDAGIIIFAALMLAGVVVFRKKIAVK